MKLKKIIKKIIPFFILEFYWNYKLKKKIFYGRDKIDRDILQYLSYENGFFIELGANDGLKESNTYYFEKNLNWKGILIEPHFSNYQKCIKNRSRKNFFYNNACVSFGFKDKYVDLLFSDLMTVPLNLETDNSSLPLKHAEEGKKYLNKNQSIAKFKSEASTLNDILNKSNSPKIIDFLSLDVEGAELEVLKGIDHSQYRFKYILVECRDKDKMFNYMKNINYNYISQLNRFDFLFKDNN